MKTLKIWIQRLHLFQRFSDSDRMVICCGLGNPGEWVRRKETPNHQTLMTYRPLVMSRYRSISSLSVAVCELRRPRK